MAPIAMLGESVVRVRGTFIDISPEVAPQKKRSRSAPPTNGGGSVWGSEWIAGWMKRASGISNVHSEPEPMGYTRSKRNRRISNEAWVPPTTNEKLCVESKANVHYHMFCGRRGWEASKGDAYGDVSPPIGQGLPLSDVSEWQESNQWQESNFLDMSCPVDLGEPVHSSLVLQSLLEDTGTPNHLLLSRRGPCKSLKHKVLAEDNLAKARREDAAKVTTLMICGIPCRQSVDQIIEAINMTGFENTYNLLYVPAKRPRISQNLGYAFVNFKTPEHAASFGQAFQNFCFPSSLSTKLCHTKPACHQGYQENLSRYTKHSAVGCLVTFDDGTLIEMQ